MICFCIVLIPKKEFFLSVTLCFKHLVLFRFLTAGKNIWTVGVPLNVYWRGAVSVLFLPVALNVSNALCTSLRRKLIFKVPPLSLLNLLVYIIADKNNGEIESHTKRMPHSPGETSPVCHSLSWSSHRDCYGHILYYCKSLIGHSFCFSKLCKMP